MKLVETRKFVHDLNNALNVAVINTFLLRRIHGDALDKEAIDNIEASLHDAELLIVKFETNLRSRQSNRQNNST
jgi:hypothetical protein